MTIDQVLRKLSGAAKAAHQDSMPPEEELAMLRRALPIVALLSLALTTHAQTLLVDASSSAQRNGSCYPFGVGPVNWTPNLVAVYQNIPAFSVAPGDTIAFDTYAQNDTNVQLDIYIVSTTVNGGDQPAGAWVKLVDNTQVAADPDGDTTYGNFDLAYTIQSSFTHTGGGLLLRFANPGGPFASDTVCQTNVVSAYSFDSPSLFLGHTFGIADPISYPFAGTPRSLTPQFQISGSPNSAPTATVNAPAGGATVSGDVTIDFDIADADGDPLSVTLEISEDGGATFSAATIVAGGSVSTNPASGLSAGTYTATWDSASQIPGTSGVDQVVVRVTVDDGSATGAATGAGFTVDNATAALPGTSLLSRLAILVLFALGAIAIGRRA